MSTTRIPSAFRSLRLTFEPGEGPKVTFRPNNGADPVEAFLISFNGSFSVSLSIPEAEWQVEMSGCSLVYRLKSGAWSKPREGWRLPEVPPRYGYFTRETFVKEASPDIAKLVLDQWPTDVFTLLHKTADEKLFSTYTKDA